MSIAEARSILAQWNGHLKTMCLLRFTPELSTTLAVHSSKVLVLVSSNMGALECRFGNHHCVMNIVSHSRISHLHLQYFHSFNCCYSFSI